jgi:hypothetical protein
LTTLDEIDPEERRYERRLHTITSMRDRTARWLFPKVTKSQEVMAMVVVAHVL